MWKQYAADASEFSLAYKNDYISKILGNTDTILYRVCYLVPSIVVNNFKLKDKLLNKNNTDNLYQLHIAKFDENENLDFLRDINVNLSKIFESLRELSDEIENKKENSKKIFGEL